MHGKYAFVRIETVTERRRLRRLFFCVFLLPIACTLPAVAVTKARLLQKLSLCPLQIVRKNNFFGVAMQAFSCFCQALCFAPSFFLRFSFPIVCTLPAVAVTKARLRQKLASLCPFANCTKKQLFRRGYTSIFLLLSGSLFCTVFFFAFFFCRL